MIGLSRSRRSRPGCSAGLPQHDPVCDGRSAQSLFTQEVNDDTAGVRFGAVFPNVYPLPGAERKPTSGYRDTEIHRCKGRAHMSGHVIIALSRMLKQRVAVRCKTRKEALKITPNFRVRILLDQERGGSVLNMQCNQAGVNLSFVDQRSDVTGDFVKAATASLDREFMHGLSEHAGTIQPEPVLRKHAPEALPGPLPSTSFNPVAVSDSFVYLSASFENKELWR